MIFKKIVLQKILFLGFVLIACTQLSAQIKQPVDYVNPFIGTEKSTHLTMWESKGATFPGVLLPYGMVQITPDGYMYSDKKIKSFSFLNHYSGYGSYGSFNLMAFTGDSLSAGNRSSAFDHTTETSSPYFYQVMLDNFGIKAAFTATERVGLCRFTFPESSSTHFVLSDVVGVKVIDSSTISGHCGGYYFLAQFSKPFKSCGLSTQQSGKLSDTATTEAPAEFFINYSTANDEVILVKIAFSTVSFSGVINNRMKELPDWNFEQTCMRSKKIWNAKLGQIEVKTADENTKEIFYTALYHAMFMPIVLSDANSKKDKYTALFPWDTYRTKHPLITILSPERESDMISAVLSEYDNTGWLPTDNMMGNHNTELILDSYVKGAINFDAAKAAVAMRKSLLDSPYARREMNDFVTYGFVPANIASSVTHSLEFAYNNWAVADFLEKTGNKKKYLKEYDTLRERARYYQNSFDVTTGFMKAKTTGGAFVDGGYSEGTSWTYSWYVPQDVQGLINLMGGKKVFSKRLSECFDEGHYVHDNEPPLHYAWLFNFCGDPWKTQLHTRKILEESYSADPGGLPGNDDLGTLSSWYVLSAMGFYPVTPGTTQYQIGSPVFDETTIHLSNGHQFVIKANKVSQQNKYIQSASINGTPLNRPWFTHQEILNGSTLVLEMGPLPNKSWASKEENKPYSMTKETPDFIIRKMHISATTAKANEATDLSVRVKNTSKVAGMVSIPVWIGGQLLKTVSAILNAHENKIIHIPITLYQQGKHSIQIPGVATCKLTIQKTDPTFLYSDLNIPFPPLFNLKDSFCVSAKVKNLGSYQVSTVVNLFINGQVVQAKKTTLTPGDEKEIKFSYTATREGISRIGIATLQPALVNILTRTVQKQISYAALSSLNPLLILNFDQPETAAITDFSGQRNDGIISGNLNWVDGIFGKAIQTNAYAGNYIVFPANTSLGKSGALTTLTMMAWVKPMDEKNFSDIISKGDWNALQLKGSNQLINFYSNGWEGHEATVTVPENWNQHWHHLAGVEDGTYFKLYVDGKLVENKKGELRNPKGETGMSDYSNNLWNIGRNETAVDRVFNGYIDDVMIFKNALTQEQIIDLMLHNF